MCLYARTLKDLNCPSTITKNVYCDFKNLDILKPFRGCRSGKSVKCNLKARKLNIQTHHQRCELKLHASKSTRPRTVRGQRGGNHLKHSNGMCISSIEPYV